MGVTEGKMKVEHAKTEARKETRVEKEKQWDLMRRGPTPL